MPGRRTLLIAEDNPDLLEFYRYALASVGHEVRVATDGLEALHKLDAFRTDLVVLDLMMPLISGYDVLAELEADPELRRLPVVVVTGMPAVPKHPNVCCVLRKPVEADDLRNAVRRCLRSRAGC